MPDLPLKLRAARVARFSTLIGVGTPKQIAQRIAKQALTGDSRDPLTAHCLKLCVERLWPALQRSEQSMDATVQHKHELVEMARHISKSELRQIETAARDILRARVSDGKPTLQ